MTTREPAELTEGDLATVAALVRKRMTAKFGSERVSIFFQRDPVMTPELMRATYVAVRTLLELGSTSFYQDSDDKCVPSSGTGRHQGAFGGPGWPMCGYCGGTGKSCHS